MENELKYNLQKLNPQTQEEVRKKIVREMKKRGNAKEVAEICECTVRHVNKTWKKYCEGGIEAILAVKMGRPVGLCKRLALEQELATQKEIILWFSSGEKKTQNISLCSICHHIHQKTCPTTQRYVKM